MAPPAKARDNGQPTTLKLKVTLNVIGHDIWRMLEVPSDMTLADLSDALVEAMGWDGDHLHVFYARGVKYWTSPAYDDSDLDYEDDSEHEVRELLWRSRMKIMWEYDLGYSWTHDIVVQSIKPTDPEVVLPRCIDGSGACPPEDSGFDTRYWAMREAHGDKAHPRHAEAIKYLGADLDLTHFDPVEHLEARRNRQRVKDAMRAGEPFPASWLK